MILLFQRETCPHCKPVRELLTNLQIDYITMNVAKDRSDRKKMERLTGTHFIPALLDGETVLPGKLENCQHLLDYLEATYGAGGVSGS